MEDIFEEGKTPYGIVYQSKKAARIAHRLFTHSHFGKFSSDLQLNIKICANAKLPEGERLFFYDSHMYALYALNNNVTHVN